MQLNKFCELTERTCAKLNNENLDNFHMLMGMATEIGELIDVFKKNLAYNKPIDWVNVQEEIGDLMFYVGSFCRMHGFDLEKILDTNIQKLIARYPEKFTKENAINRNLDKEREILEK